MRDLETEIAQGRFPRRLSDAEQPWSIAVDNLTGSTAPPVHPKALAPSS